MIGKLYGPMTGNTHDSTLHSHSRLNDQLRDVQVQEEEVSMDSALDKTCFLTFTMTNWSYVILFLFMHLSSSSPAHIWTANEDRSRDTVRLVRGQGLHRQVPLFPGIQGGTQQPAHGRAD
jgi:hypothetical protein